MQYVEAFFVEVVNVCSLFGVRNLVLDLRREVTWRIRREEGRGKREESSHVKERRGEEREKVNTKLIRYLAIFCIFLSSACEPGPSKMHNSMRGVTPDLSSAWMSDWSDLTTYWINSKSGTIAGEERGKAKG